MANTYKVAKWACEDLSGRLPTERELMAIARAGDYFGGISMSLNYRDHRYWALGGNQVYSLPVRQSFDVTALNGDKYLRYICVK